MLIGYVNVAYADQFITERFLSTETVRLNWEALTKEDKEVLLRRSFESIEMLPFPGRKVKPCQDTQFPRFPWACKCVQPEEPEEPGEPVEPGPEEPTPEPTPEPELLLLTDSEPEIPIEPEPDPEPGPVEPEPEPEKPECMEDVPLDIFWAQVYNALALANPEELGDLAEYEKLRRLGVTSYKLGNLQEVLGLRGGLGADQLMVDLGIISEDAMRILRRYLSGGYSVIGKFRRCTL